MTTLTRHQHTKVQAGLALIHDYGHDAKAVDRAAKHHIASGLGPKQSYERAFTEFTKDKPDLLRAMIQTIDVIHASDDATVARYADALRQYDETGNPAALHEVAETFAQDSIALAVRNGDLSPEEANDPAAISVAFGFSPGMLDALPTAAPQQVAAPADGPKAAFAPRFPTLGNSVSRPAASVRASFSGKDAQPGASVWGQFQGDKRAALASATMCQPVDPGRGPASFKPIEPGSGPIVKGYTESNTYG